MANKAEIRVLIVEDDPSLGPALVELFERGGYDAHLAPSPDVAESLFDQLDFSAVLIDCMLPKINGVDLSLSLMKKADSTPLLFLMTGVFKDKAFVKNAIVKTNAI